MEMTKEMTEKETEAALEAMMKEDTGKVMGDSGDAYGRHWERNQGVDFDQQPEAWINVYGLNPEPTLSVYHHMRHYLEYDEAQTSMYDWFKEKRDHPSEMAYMDAFLDYAFGTQREPDAETDFINTANHPSYLSQTLSYKGWAYDGVTRILLRVHNGADIRGGYTTARVFFLEKPGAFLNSIQRLSFGCGYGHRWVKTQSRWWETEDTDAEPLHSYNKVSIENMDDIAVARMVVDEHRDKVYCPVCQPTEKDILDDPDVELTIRPYRL